MEYVKHCTALHSTTAWNFGRSSRTSPSNSSIWKRGSAPTKLDKDATSFDVLPTIWGNHGGPMPSTPLIEPSSFGRQSRSEDQFPCEHPGFSRQHGNVTSRLRSPHMFTPPSTTMFPYKNHQLASSSPNSRRSWTAYATTRKRRLDGLMVKHLRVFAQLFAVILPILLQKDNPSFWMVTYQEKINMKIIKMVSRKINKTKYWFATADKKTISESIKILIVINMRCWGQICNRLRTQWDIRMIPSDLELRYADLDGDVFQVRNESSTQVLEEYRPERRIKQYNLLHSSPLIPGTSQPFIFRLTFRKVRQGVILPWFPCLPIWNRPVDAVENFSLNGTGLSQGTPYIWWCLIAFDIRPITITSYVHGLGPSREPHKLFWWCFTSLRFCAYLITLILIYSCKLLQVSGSKLRGLSEGTSSYPSCAHGSQTRPESRNLVFLVAR